MDFTSPQHQIYVQAMNDAATARRHFFTAAQEFVNAYEALNKAQAAEAKAKSEYIAANHNESDE